MQYRIYILVLISCMMISMQGLFAQRLVPTTVEMISRVTGKSLKGESIPNPNNTHTKYDVGGTDLGIVWELGNGKTGIVFGDTFGGEDWAPGNDTTHWRCNVLAFSSDNKLDDGLRIDNMVVASSQKAKAKEIIYGGKDKSGLGNWTSIPTAAIRVNGMDYIHYMNVKNWEKPGQWATNYSGLAVSADNGKTWEVAGMTISGQSNFAQCAFATDDKYVYLLGTTSGRLGDVYLARCFKSDLLDAGKYTYWNAGQWMSQEKEAAPLFKGPAGELSVMYNSYFKKWIAVYLSHVQGALVMRSADQIDGTWSEESILLQNGGEYPGLYGGYIHPAANNSPDLYFLISLWGKYNVFLMHTKLKKDKI